MGKQATSAETSDLQGSCEQMARRAHAAAQILATARGALKDQWLHEVIAGLAGRQQEIRLLPLGGSRIVRGHGGLVDGSLDEPGALEAAIALAAERGYRDV